jgi:hypothetical protein
MARRRREVNGPAYWAGAWAPRKVIEIRLTPATRRVIHVLEGKDIHMKIEVDTSEFEFAHGKKPRGRGGWAFGFTRRATLEDLYWTHNATYSEATKLAKAKARELGVHTIHLQS